jgi:hypothetical protein
LLTECNKCKSAGFPNQEIDFQKIGINPVTGKNIWKLLEKDGITEHRHKQQPQQQQNQSNSYNNNKQRQDSIKNCRYCNKQITFHDNRTAPSGKKIPLNLDSTVHDCENNPFNRSRKERS